MCKQKRGYLTGHFPCASLKISRIAKRREEESSRLEAAQRNPPKGIGPGLGEDGQRAGEHGFGAAHRAGMERCL